MIAKHNLCTLLEKYCYTNKITVREIAFLENCFEDSLLKKQFQTNPSIAPAIVCDVAGLERGSYWISCNAAILDQLKPIKGIKSRTARILDLLLKSGLVAA